MILKFIKSGFSSLKYIINDKIPFLSTIIIDQNGKRIGNGPLSIKEFLKSFDMVNLDLRLVNDKCEPPISRVFPKASSVDEGENVNSTHKKEKVTKKNILQKEIRFTTVMASNDLSTKWRQMKKLILKGNEILLRVGGNGKSRIDAQKRDILMKELQERVMQEFPQKITILSMPNIKPDGTSQISFILKD